jgi:hypothetical protein
VAAAAGAGCVDLFHSTANIRTACENDASAAGCLVDFCSWSSAEAKAHAARACAWLGACEGPLGSNAFGLCTVQARLAFDCEANPSHPARGTVYALWACLAGATNCAAVSSCLAAEAIACADASAAIAYDPENAGLRVSCAGAGAPPLVENCALWEQSCGPADGGATCGPSGSPIDCNADESACGSTTATVRVCSGGQQVGLDCVGNGAQMCHEYVAGDSAWVACVPETTSAATCKASLGVSCEGGVASACLAGIPESIDCDSLLDTSNACVAGAIAGGFDWTSGCSLGDACPADSCSGSTLQSCARGATFGVDCSTLGLGPCRTVATGDEGPNRAACTPP